MGQPTAFDIARAEREARTPVYFVEGGGLPPLIRQAHRMRGRRRFPFAQHPALGDGHSDGPVYCFLGRLRMSQAQLMHGYPAHRDAAGDRIDLITELAGKADRCFWHGRFNESAAKAFLLPRRRLPATKLGADLVQSHDGPSGLVCELVGLV